MTLSWSIGEQNDIVRYVIERSKDGRTLMAIASIANIADDTHYAAADSGAYSGRSNYRLGMETAGATGYSEIRSVVLQQEAFARRLGPVQAIASVTVQFSDASLANTVAYFRICRAEI